MKTRKIILGALLLLACMPGLSQTSEINELDQNGQKHGKWIKKYPDGNILYTGKFKHGQPVGIFKRYHPNGELKAIMEYKSNTKVYAELYNKEGVKQAEGIYLNQKKDSVWCLYDENGTLVSKDSYDKGQRDGKSYKYYPSGQVSQMMSWTQGKRDGVFKLYFENGNTKMQGMYKQGIIDGYLTFFYPSGRKKIEGKYSQNLREGEWVYYNEHGDTSQVINYTRGIPENEDSLERIETQEILDLEKNEGKFADPRDQFYNNSQRK